VTLSAASYLAGALELAAIVAPLAYAAWRLRATALAAWTGAPARLVETVLAVVGLLWLSELLGTVGLFEDAPMIIGSIAVGIAAEFACRRLAPSEAQAPPVAASSGLAWACAAIVCAGVAAGWMVPTLASLAGGMDRADTLWYHMPLAAKFVQTGHLGSIYHFDPIFFASFYPANSEVVHAVGILAFGRDIVSPLLNLGWLAVGLLASYCIGRPYGVGPASLIGGAIALGSQQLVEFQAGEALNDITGVAFLLAAVAIVVNAGAAGTLSRPAWALSFAGLAAGVAAGVKLSFLAPVGALFVGVIVIAGRGERIRTALWFGVPALLAGGYWYLRNLIAIGNPIPFTPWGPLHLPSPARDFELREPFSVAHYLTDTDIWKDWFFPGLHDSFGLLWPLVIAGFIGAGVWGLWRGGGPVARVLGAVVLFTAVAYVFTPLTAAGEPGQPIAFEWNVRYIAPAAAIGLALLPTLPAARSGSRARLITLGALTVLAAVTIGSLVQWDQGHVKGAVAAGVGVLAVWGLLFWLRSSGRLDAAAPRRYAVGVAAVVAAGALGAGWWVQHHYLPRRYEMLSPALDIAGAARWANTVHDSKIAIAGVRGVFNQYPFYGDDLSNEVQWLGKDGPDGAYLRIPTCAEWRQALADGGYRYVVTMYDPYRPGTLTDTKEALWTRKDAASRQILRDGPVSVFELDGKPDSSTCDDLPDLSPPELNGDSVNNDPTANQP
jgi:hypothetical protein